MVTGTGIAAMVLSSVLNMAYVFMPQLLQRATHDFSFKVVKDHCATQVRMPTADSEQHHTTVLAHTSADKRNNLKMDNLSRGG